MLKNHYARILLPWNRLPPICRGSALTTSSYRRRGCRPYAAEPNSRHQEDLPWPDLRSATSIPTPYQIFNQERNSPYSKSRYYALVKLYHPDRRNPYEKLSDSTRLERYRLVVAANSILSDPIKRKIYDSYGTGWTEEQVNYRRWRDEAGSPSQNATWEDWESWRYRQSNNTPQEPTYLTNGAFISLVILFGAIGIILQATRVGNYSVNFMEQQEALHRNLSKDLVRRRKETTTAFGSSDERIDNFLRHRDPIGYGLTDPREESYRKQMPIQEICSSQDIKGRRMDIYHSKNDPKDR